jgi:hypothetical protein
MTAAVIALSGLGVVTSAFAQCSGICAGSGGNGGNGNGNGNTVTGTFGQGHTNGNGNGMPGGNCVNVGCHATNGSPGGSGLGNG